LVWFGLVLNRYSHSSLSVLGRVKALMMPIISF